MQDLIISVGCEFPALTPYDNALAENFFSILKAKCIYRHKIDTLAEARELIDDYIHFYNHQRIEAKTKLTPLELKRQYVA